MLVSGEITHKPKYVPAGVTCLSGTRLHICCRSCCWPGCGSPRGSGQTSCQDAASSSSSSRWPSHRLHSQTVSLLKFVSIFFSVVNSSSELFDILSMSVLCLHCCISPHSQWTLGACVFPPSAFGLSVTQMSKLSEGPISSLHRWRWERWCQSLSAPNVTVVWGAGSGGREVLSDREGGCFLWSEVYLMDTNTKV